MEVLHMSQTLTLPDELYNKLTRGAADRGLTIESLLTVVSDMIVLPDRPTKRDRERTRRIERLLAKYAAGPLTERDRAELDQLIDVDYQDATARADRLIAANQSDPAASSAAAGARQVGRSSRSPARLRK